MNDSLKYFLSSLFHVITRFVCVFPIKPRKIMFEVYMGDKYACSPKSICEYIDSKSDEYELIWVYHKNRIPCKYKQVKRNSLAYFYHMLTAGFIIINSGNNHLLRYRAKQVMINTWHGGGAYKRLTISPLERYRKNDFFISSCEKASQFVIQEGQNFHGRILNFGLPRNDMLINFDNQKAIEVKKQLKIGNKKCVLYAPTYRNDFSKTEFALDYDRLVKMLEQRFGGEWVILMRCHYHMRPDCKQSSFRNMIDVTQYPDMQDLLLISDALITDYSSSKWDYSFLKRPAFLYATDLKEYDEERSFFVDIHEWPFPLCENNDELAQAIENFNQDKLECSIQKHHDFMGNFEKGNASELTFAFMQRFIEENY